MRSVYVHYDSEDFRVQLAHAVYTSTTNIELVQYIGHGLSFDYLAFFAVLRPFLRVSVISLEFFDLSCLKYA